MMPGTLSTARATASIFSQSPAPGVSDRRRQLRFPITARLRYSLKSGRGGEGLLLNISSGGVLFHCDTVPPVGRIVDLVMPWPALLHGSCPLQLRIQGRVLRNTLYGTAVKIERYEFHTAVRRPSDGAKPAAAGFC